MSDKWVPFWFEGNHAWGRIDTIEDWEDVKESYSEYPYVDLGNAKRHYSGKEHFGFGSSYRGQTLKEFFAENGMEM